MFKLSLYVAPYVNILYNVCRKVIYILSKYAEVQTFPCQNKILQTTAAVPVSAEVILY